MSLAGALPRLSNQALAAIRLEAEERLIRHRGSGPDCQSCKLNRELASMAQEIETRRRDALVTDDAPMSEVWTPLYKPQVGDELTADALAACPWVIEYEVLESHFVVQDEHRIKVIDRVKVLGVREAPRSVEEQKAAEAAAREQPEEPDA